MRKIIKYWLIIVKDWKFLINRKKNTKLFIMPGWKPKKWEEILNCLKRELKEEHNVDLIDNSVSYFWEFEDLAANEKDTIIHSKLYFWNIIWNPSINNEIVEQKWFWRNDNKEILSSLISNKILPSLLEKEVI